MFPTSCQICFLDYDTDQRKIMVGSCGHSLCRSCQLNIANDLTSTCPFCQLPRSFSNAVPNYLAIEMLNHRPTSSNTDGSTSGQIIAQLDVIKEYILSQDNTINQQARSLEDQNGELEENTVIIQALSSQLEAKGKKKKWKWFGMKRSANTRTEQ